MLFLLTIQFGAMYIPIGKGFTTKVVYGNDVFKRTYGVNTHANTPEIAKITIQYNNCIISGTTRSLELIIK
jgi:hypothetical protein